MQMVKKIFSLIVIIWAAVIVLMPKQEFYYLLEQELAKSDIVISSEQISEGWFSLSIKEPSVFVKGIKVATIEEINLFTLLFYTKSSLEGITLDSSLSKFAPEKIDEAVMSHSLISPMNAAISANGVFGEADGAIDLNEKRVKVIFSEIEKLGMLKSQLKKEEEGWLYETSF